MLWNKKLKSIFGFFWNSVWQDTWLIECILKFFTFIFDSTQLKGLDRVYKQLSVGSELKPLDSCPFLILIPVDSLRQQAYVLSLLLLLGFLLGAETGTGMLYTVINTIESPIRLVDKIVLPLTVLYKGADFLFAEDVLTTNIPLSNSRLDTRVVTFNNIPTLCYILWGYSQSTLFLSDAYTAILDLPKTWLLRYRDSIKTAWNIQLRGPSIHAVKNLLGVLTLCPVAEETLYVLLITELYIKTPKHTYIIHENRHTKIEPGSFVLKGDPLTYITDTVDSVYIYLSIPLFILYIPVLTLVGYLKARNLSNIPVYNNILPLLGEFKNAYLELCKKRNADITVPYALLPATLNPADWVAKNLWGGRCYFICLPSVFNLDIARGLEFVLKHIPLGSIPLVLQYVPELHRFLYTILPLIVAGGLILLYYNNSVNNRHIYKEPKDAVTE